ncbi:MAG: hypothetical protein EBU66_17635 [Bacteroidetes bacterium]|nr:hypothetical protein [bacterium]NBP66454.1 hypothetical protein [Bacteroidota bacterium]
MTDKQFSIVLALKNATHNEGTNNLERFARIGLPTYEKFMKKEDVAEFIIVCPMAEMEKIKQVTAVYEGWNWKIYGEEQLLHIGLRAGWAKQQTIKLAIAPLVKTGEYLIIDDDTYLTRPFGYDNLRTKSGKLIMNRINIDFPFFYLWSNQILDYDFDKVQDFPVNMAITPEIFNTSVVRDLVKLLVTKYGSQKQWQLKLEQNKFTEYALYWIYLQMINKTDMYDLNEKSPQLYNYAITSNDQPLEKYIDLAFNDKKSPFYFSFVQSSTSYKVDEIYDVVKKYVDI